MEKFQELRDLARKRIKVADHMLTTSYVMVADPKILLAALQNVFLAMTYGMGAILHHQRLFKKIPPFQDTFNSKYNMFRSKIVDQYKLDKAYIDQMQEIHEVLLEHKKSPMEFIRKDKFVICSDRYEMKTISLEKMKSYINQTKAFLNKAEEIVKEDEEIFKK